MRVLLVNVNCKKGSTGKIAYDLYTELNSTGHAAAICFGRGKAMNEPNIFKISSNLEMYVHALLTRITGLTGYYSPFATRKLIKSIKEFKPDVVHLHEVKTYYLNIGTIVKFLKRESIKTVWTLHSEFLYTGKCGYTNDCENWKYGCGRCPNIKGYPKSFLFDFTRKMFNDKKKMMKDFSNLILVSPSEWLANRVKQTFLNDKQVMVVHNGIDIQNIFHPTEVKEIKHKYNLENTKIVLAVAPDLMSERKGGRWIIELAKEFKNKPVRFVLIGITDLNEKFDDNIIPIGRTENQKELAAFYSMADLFIICSEKENFPTTCIEALACGTPIVGFDAGGTKETAPEGYGIFIPFGDIQQMVNTILLSLEDKEILKSKDECAEFAKENYSKSTMSDKYLNIYESLLQSK